MKIGILTHPLESNYGGILQNYALQQALIRLGHQPITIDYHPLPPAGESIRHNLKSIFRLVCKGIKPRFRFIDRPNPKFRKFISDNINTTQYYLTLKQNIIADNRLDAIIVGSDQVWSHLYIKRYKISNMFLGFIHNDCNIPKISYAASFGVDKWHYNQTDTAMMRQLISRFDAVSVREASGVNLCREHLRCDAIHLLDPTLLLNATDYSKLIKRKTTTEENTLLAYILDKSPEKIAHINHIATKLNLKVKIVGAHSNVSYSIEEWLNLFKNCHYVVTDSYHGTIFSIIFRKDFSCIVNTQRGGDRFHSLLSMLELNNRLLIDNRPDTSPINWDKTEKRIEFHQNASFEFLRKHLEK